MGLMITAWEAKIREKTQKVGHRYVRVPWQRERVREREKERERKGERVRENEREREREKKIGSFFFILNLYLKI